MFQAQTLRAKLVSELRIMVLVVAHCPAEGTGNKSILPGPQKLSALCGIMCQLTKLKSLTVIGRVRGGKI